MPTIPVKLTDREFADAQNICSLRKLSLDGHPDVEGYLKGLLAADRAEVAALKISVNFLYSDLPLLEGPAEPPLPNLGNKETKRRVSAATAQKVLLLRDEGLNPPAIAKRLGISTMRVHRIFREHDNCKTHVQRPCGNPWGRNGKPQTEATKNV